MQIQYSCNNQKFVQQLLSTMQYVCKIVQVLLQIIAMNTIPVYIQKPRSTHFSSINGTLQIYAIPKRYIQTKEEGISDIFTSNIKKKKKKNYAFNFETDNY
ncbi:hypothetical protein HanXRQr2_Chr14g0660691 [Helianthus annuus]|uniref:Uncharacterized protein n=1 Tax=Helianthus annuus TaxID=4232 RepID=A0A9K3EBL2_HELAN|nr:hypothetical protein HanXRQr2_Chr14g0660691 [Helianthus annuus]KAJ0841750.1 hypothetical protein HanPSC8_Chr14g0633921 [Helianthus annuus]